jgi:hypothetical protein
MDLETNLETRLRLFNAQRDHIQCFNWEWFASLTFPDYRRYKKYQARNLLLRWVHSLCNSERLQVGFCSALGYSKNGHPHYHLVMIGRNRKNKTLLDVDCTKWERGWNYIAQIEPIESIENVSAYLARHHFFKYCLRVYFDFYNTKLLNRHRM